MIKKEWIENRQRSTADVIADLPELVKPYAYIVGAWVWITFPDKPENDIRQSIKDLGFLWNNNRKAWQHPCGVFRKSSPGDPRSKYGITQLDELEVQPS